MLDTIRFGLLGSRYVTISDAGIDVSAVRPADLARGLARIPRFGGQTKKPYSVARHSVILADWVARRERGNRALERLALLHDAPEALGVNDIQHFIKRAYGADLKALESRILDALLSHFDTRPVSLDHSVVGTLDHRLGTVEANYFGWPTTDFRSDPGDPDLAFEFRKYREALCPAAEWLRRWEDVS